MHAQDKDIIFKEKYGSNGRVITYLNPRARDQKGIVAVDTKKFSSIILWLKSLFLPQGFPDSVSPDYIQYQIWDTAQAFCSTITGTLATQEVLRGVGVGDTNASPLAATITWVLKDGCGHIGRIYFASRYGIYLDAYSKKWRLYADCLNDAAICMEMALPVFAGHTTTLLCLTTMMKAVVGVAGGATRAALTQHHAIRFNMADVSAKDSAQETAVNLIASVVALFIITYIGNSLMIFALLIFLHVVFNYLAVRSVCLRTFNEPRFIQTIGRYLKHQIVSAPCEVNKSEPIIGRSDFDVRLCGFHIKLGHSLKHILTQEFTYDQLMEFKNMYSYKTYMILPCLKKRHMYVVLMEDATTMDVLQGYFHAIFLSILICSINYYPLLIIENSAKASPFTKVCHTIQKADWSKETPSGKTGKGSEGNFQNAPSHKLLGYCIDNVEKEWQQLKVGLRKTGWNLDKHLLVTDEWRIENCSRKED